MRAFSVASSRLSSAETSSNGRVRAGSIASTLTMAMPKRPSIGALISPDFRAKAASPTARSTTAVLVTVPRSMSVSLSPRSAASASKLVPPASFSDAALASSMFGNTICLSLRRSGVSNRDLRAS